MPELSCEDIFWQILSPWRQEVEGQERFSIDKIYLKVSNVSHDRIRVWELLIIQDAVEETVLFFCVVIRALLCINLSRSFYQSRIFGLRKNTEKVTSPSDFHAFISSMIRVKIYILRDSLYRHMYMRVPVKICVLCDSLYRHMYMCVHVKMPWDPFWG